MTRTRSPALVGRYRLADPVGVGGSGTVWRAWDLRSERWVAAKLLRRYDEELLLRFVREQAVRIRHPHVLAPRGWAAEDDVAVIVSDLVRGGSVSDLRRAAGPLPEGFVVALLDQALQALVAVHAGDVVHGDVKPANLLLEPTGSGRPHLRLADFGVATGRDDRVVFTRAGPVGTAGYLAPDQESGAPPEPAQDLYALGITGRRLLAGPAPVATLLDSLTRPEARLRPSASDALDRLRSLPVRRGPAWPAVRDRLGPDPVVRRAWLR
ncbi:serine/threonine-protein kinase [Nocardioides lianchengensis]|uniref:non-specific serine/threonine protein kinase n=1 Tax=Nocardioides lianchengensis TaxID=1045774 RepID=A0A1G6LGD9_9ACTN|nr:serine/threonine-protein kinase [Nocardioides lianchengensis]NYG12563.1 serine/threonine-protein kinase [Nocardioides lianchengensis]SDC42348.1 serine/threonine protein kinase [Nocardioides lianchengensis]